jgi:signal transduction histidine kinase
MEVQSADVARPAVLMVDDHAPNLVALEAVLASLDADLVPASSGEEALRRIAEREFAVVLLDQRMPGLSGTETVAALGAPVTSPRPPIILLTAYSLDDAEIREAYRLGVVDTVQKPYLPEVLKTKVQVFVELFRFRELLRVKLLEEERRERLRFEQELVAMVSHDLRTPLTVISLGASRLLQSEVDAETTRRIAGRVSVAAARAARLTQDLLAFTEARHRDRIPVHIESGDLHRVVEDTVEDLRLEHSAHLIDVEHRGDGTGEFDPDRVAQIITNLVSNAVRYGTRGEPIHVRSFGTEAELGLEVNNAGPPIPEEEKKKLFEPLQRGKGSEQRAHGLGLGLFIVDRIVSAHQGKIEIESDASHGTTFRVTLPRTTSPR